MSAVARLLYRRTLRFDWSGDTEDMFVLDWHLDSYCCTACGEEFEGLRRARCCPQCGEPLVYPKHVSGDVPEYKYETIAIIELRHLNEAAVGGGDHERR